ncbi:hypothetical protein K0M31_011833 [Melipona bicolor]|uniref:Uncharacterized protein n=1 Tax=Melipona bicolor TaxID=60889 RepID=A0AA40KV46_9HYME|nr:hypothetical protein K0M31_011833 [Melipona bicolor]
MALTLRAPSRKLLSNYSGNRLDNVVNYSEKSSREYVEANLDIDIEEESRKNRERSVGQAGNNNETSLERLRVSGAAHRYHFRAIGYVIETSRSLIEPEIKWKQVPNDKKIEHASCWSVLVVACGSIDD